MSGAVANSPHRATESRAPGLEPRLLSEARWPGVTLAVKEQNISELTTWKLQSKQHILVVHLNGAIHKLETELQGVGMLQHPPMNGEVWVIPSETPYSSLARGKVVRYAELFFDEDGLVGLGLRSRGFGILPKAGHYDTHLYRVVQHLIHLVDQSDDMARMEAEVFSRAIFLHFFRNYSAESLPFVRNRLVPKFADHEKKLLQEYIDEHLAMPISLADLAGIADRTIHQLLIDFRCTFGATPMQYIMERRLRLARFLLRGSTRDITSIALEAGFSSHSHFTTAFRNRVGVTPSAFRKE